MNELIFLGGEVKAMGGGRVCGQLVQYSTADAPDLSRHRDFFDSSTDFDIEDGQKTSVYFHHGLDATLGTRRLGKVEMKANDVGVWVDGILDMRDDYEREVYRLAEAGKLGWSSGATTHLVRREKVEGKNASHVTYWPISEASLTPTPADFRNQALVPAESLAVKSFLELTDLDAPPAKKDYQFVAEPPYLGDNLAQNTSYSVLSDLSDRMSWFALELLGSDLPTADKMRVMGEALNEFRASALSVVTALLSAVPDSDEAKSLKTMLETGPGAGAASDAIKRLPTGEFLKAMGAVVADSQRRLEWAEDARAMKQGRPISAANIAAMRTIRDGMQGHVDMLTGMIARHDPDAESGHDGKSTQDASTSSLEGELAKFSQMRFLDLNSAASLTFG